MRFSVLLIVALLLAYLMSIDARDQAEEKRSTMKKGGHGIMIMPRDVCEDNRVYCTSPFCQEELEYEDANVTCVDACNIWFANCQEK
uniref:Venom peptide Pna9.2 n=1 Tax=Purpuraturris nadaensis TaxID=3243997 RepID=A0A976QLV9_9CAEN|nr:venom peptide precursor Pna9.2 [Turris nadaensis]